MILIGIKANNFQNDMEILENLVFEKQILYLKLGLDLIQRYLLHDHYQFCYDTL